MNQQPGGVDQQSGDRAIVEVDGPQPSPAEENTITVSVQNLAKKYCQHLRRSMWYGIRDIVTELTLHDRKPELRPGEFHAVRNVTFQVRRGECVGLIGANGAGKSTLLKMLAGVLRPDRGRIELTGKVGALLELNTGMNTVLSGRENAFIKGSMYGLSKREVVQHIEEIIDFSGMREKFDSPMRMLSSGEKARIAFSITMVLKPDLLLIDEVLAVGDVGFKLKCYEHLHELVGRGMSVILVTHMVARLPRVCDRVIVLNQGQIAFDGDVQQAIGIYQELVGASKDDSDDEEGNSQRDENAGLADAKIQKVTLLNRDGQESVEFQTGDDQTVEICLRSALQLDEMRLIVAMHSAIAGTVASVSNPHKGFRIKVKEGRTVIRLRLKRLPLLVGAYYFNISLHGPGMGDFYHRRINAASFRIVGPPVDASGNGISGLIDIDHEWTAED